MAMITFTTTAIVTTTTTMTMTACLTMITPAITTMAVSVDQRTAVIMITIIYMSMTGMHSTGTFTARIERVPCRDRLIPLGATTCIANDATAVTRFIPATLATKTGNLVAFSLEPTFASPATLHLSLDPCSVSCTWPFARISAFSHPSIHRLAHHKLYTTTNAFFQSNPISPDYLAVRVDSRFTPRRAGPCKIGGQ